MQVVVCSDKAEMGLRAARDGAVYLRAAIEDRGAANIIVATGTSQFETLNSLIAQNVDWRHVTSFHLDEYIGIAISHPASFRRYLKERLVDKLPSLKVFHYIDGEAEPQTECDRIGQLIQQHPIDVAFVGIGENGHLAFNDPPADFATDVPYIVVELDKACRRQQLGEGWFPTLEDVPCQAISMSIRQIMKSAAIVCSVPDRRKAEAVKASIQDPVSPDVPASILQQHPNATIYLDEQAAALL